jgi:hypothetical protein
MFCEKAEIHVLLFNGISENKSNSVLMLENVLFMIEKF